MPAIRMCSNHRHREAVSWPPIPKSSTVMCRLAAELERCTHNTFRPNTTSSHHGIPLALPGLKVIMTLFIICGLHLIIFCLSYDILVAELTLELDGQYPFHFPSLFFPPAQSPNLYICSDHHIFVRTSNPCIEDGYHGCGRCEHHSRNR